MSSDLQDAPPSVLNPSPNARKWSVLREVQWQGPERSAHAGASPVPASQEGLQLALKEASASVGVAKRRLSIQLGAVARRASTIAGQGAAAQSGAAAELLVSTSDSRRSHAEEVLASVPFSERDSLPAEPSLSSVASEISERSVGGGQLAAPLAPDTRGRLAGVVTAAIRRDRGLPSAELAAIARVQAAARRLLCRRAFARAREATLARVEGRAVATTAGPSRKLSLPPINPASALSRACGNHRARISSLEPSVPQEGSQTASEPRDIIMLEFDSHLHQQTCTGLIRNSNATNTTGTENSDAHDWNQEAPGHEEDANIEPGAVVVTPGYLLPLARELRFSMETHGEPTTVAGQQRRDALKLLALWEELEEMHAQTRFWKEETDRAKRPVDNLRGLVQGVTAVLRVKRLEVDDAPAEPGVLARIAAPKPPPMTSALKKPEAALGETSNTAAADRARRGNNVNRRVLIEASVARRDSEEALDRGNTLLARRAAETAPPASEADMATPRTRMVTFM